MENVSCETNSAEVIEEVKPKQKTLANCTTIEFLKQANKIRKAVANFYDDCNFGEILKRKPEFPINVSNQEAIEIAKKHRRKQISDVLDMCLETNVEKTVEIIGLMCFMTKEEAENMQANVLLGLALELISSEEVVDFFSKMVQSGMIGTEKS